MLKQFSFTFVSILLFNISSYYNFALGETFEYKCKVETEIDIQKRLFLSNKVFTGSTFTVNRSTGEIHGDLISDTGYDKTTVIHPGDDMNALKIISFAYLDQKRTQSNTQYLYIQTYTKKAQKPFIYHNGLFLLTGYCL